MALIWVHVQLCNLRLVLYLLEHPLWMGLGCVSRAFPEPIEVINSFRCSIELSLQAWQ